MATLCMMAEQMPFVEDHFDFYSYLHDFDYDDDDDENGTTATLNRNLNEAAQDYVWLYWNPVWREDPEYLEIAYGIIVKEDCKYTCHYKCHTDVRLDCTESPIHQELPDTPKEQTIFSEEQTVEETVETWSGLSRDELRRRIDEFNTLSEKDVFTLGSDTCIFVGSIKVHLNLSRPISVPTGSNLPKLCSTLKRYDHSIDTSKKRKRTSFFLPKDTVKELNIASETTTQQLVLALLERLEIIDNPRKFALFELTETGQEVLVRRITEEERPLILCLSWGASNKVKRFELRENESGSIQWEAFSIPELQNFLRILDKEEQEHIQQVQEKYARYEAQLKEAMAFVQDHHRQEVEEEAKVLEALEKKRRQSEGTPVDFDKELIRRESEENILVMDEKHFEISEA
ncbi:ras association domain-containing protein 1-like isoform X2 [Amphiura filiformis]|uniref:ras association domain-containing protein 1-like isoform X2 n=1 Tax=Amphiura filiformis TaxID=82378 RepID=UPI003B21CAD9